MCHISFYVLFVTILNFLLYWNLKDININMTLKFFLRIRIDSNQIELNRIESSFFEFESNWIETRTNRIESNHFKIRFDSIHSEPYSPGKINLTAYCISHEVIVDRLL